LEKKNGKKMDFKPSNFKIKDIGKKNTCGSWKGTLIGETKWGGGGEAGGWSKNSYINQLHLPFLGATGWGWAWGKKNLVEKSNKHVREEEKIGSIHNPRERKPTVKERKRKDKV